MKDLSTMWKIVFPVYLICIGLTFGKSTSGINDAVSSADSHRQGKCE